MYINKLNIEKIMEEDYGVTESPMSEMDMDMGMESTNKYIPKQFDMDKLMSINKDERDVIISFITSPSSMFREQIETTLNSYDLIIDQREGRINSLLRE